MPQIGHGGAPCADTDVALVGAAFGAGAIHGEVRTVSPGHVSPDIGASSVELDVSGSTGKRQVIFQVNGAVKHHGAITMARSVVTVCIEHQTGIGRMVLIPQIDLASAKAQPITSGYIATSGDFGRGDGEAFQFSGFIVAATDCLIKIHLTSAGGDLQVVRTVVRLGVDGAIEIDVACGVTGIYYPVARQFNGTGKPNMPAKPLGAGIGTRSTDGRQISIQGNSGVIGSFQTNVAGIAAVKATQGVVATCCGNRANRNRVIRVIVSSGGPNRYRAAATAHAILTDTASGIDVANCDRAIPRRDSDTPTLATGATRRKNIAGTIGVVTASCGQAIQGNATGGTGHDDLPRVPDLTQLIV